MESGEKRKAQQDFEKATKLGYKGAPGPEPGGPGGAIEPHFE